MSIRSICSISDLFIPSQHFKAPLEGSNVEVVAIDLPGSKEEQHTAQQVMEVNGPNAISPDSKVLTAVKDATIITAHFAPMGKDLIEAAKFETCE